MALLEDVIGYGLHSARPSAGSAGRLYYETDTDTLFRDNGSTWVTLTTGGGGGSGALTQIADTIVTGSVAATIAFSSIAGSYSHLELRWQARTDSDPSGHVAGLRAQFNADATSGNYIWNNIECYSGNTNNGSESASDTSILCGQITASGGPANSAAGGTIWIPHYAGTTWHKTVSGVWCRRNGTGAGTLLNGTSGGYWLATPAAISSVTLFPSAGNFAIGTRVTLYGIT